MALTANKLTLDLVTITGLDPAGIAVTVSMASPELINSVGTPPNTQTLIPSSVTVTTDSSGVAAVDLLPSSIIGPIRVSFDGFSRVVEMPAAPARLSALMDATETRPIA